MLYIKLAHNKRFHLIEGQCGEIDPETFKLHNGKLYLFFSDYYEGTPFNTIIPWNSDEENLKNKADMNWESMNK